MNNRSRSTLIAPALFLLSIAFVGGALSQTLSKVDATPAFWQRDPEANFEDEGKMHCAPTSVSDGLIYLSRQFGYKALVPGTGHEAQIKLIKELADDFGTDPSIGGTNPDKIVTGLQTYLDAHGFVIKRLELKTWRGVSGDNKKFRIGTKPDLAWMRGAAEAPDTIMVFNFGWYKEGDDGYERDGGHWVAVVGMSGTDFIVHNPLLTSEKQLQSTLVKLSPVDPDLTVVKDDGETRMNGYFEGNGTGLPHGQKVTAILDAVIVLSIDRASRPAPRREN